MKHVFIIGSKGIPSAYGGFETFVDKLTEYNQYNKDIKFHVACKSTEKGSFKYNNAHCFKIKVPNIGHFQPISYDINALKYCCHYIKYHNINSPIIYVLGCSIGPFIFKYKKKIGQLGGELFINPDGHEWMRTKWPKPVRYYLKKSEQFSIKNSDLVICDSVNIEKYILKSYKKYFPRTTFIAYGTDTKRSSLTYSDLKVQEWYSNNRLKYNNYYLIVGRFVPENNYETMIKEFMKTKTRKDLVIITNTSKKFYNELNKRIHFEKDSRIKFVGTIYDQELLKIIRENAYGYLHGHEVGGTNPSLLESLGATKLNLLLDVKFNREVATDSAFYWDKSKDNLSCLINNVELLNEKEIEKYGKMAKKRISTNYNWSYIVNQYNNLFLNGLKK